MISTLGCLSSLLSSIISDGALSILKCTASSGPFSLITIEWNDFLDTFYALVVV